MRVLIISQYFSPESFRINEVALALRDHGCDVSILTGQPNYPDGFIFDGYSAWSLKSEVWHGLDLFRVPLVPRGRGSALGLIANYVSFIISACIFGPWHLRGRSIDAILVFGMSPILQAIPAILFARIKKAALLTWVQDLWPESLRVAGFIRSQKLLTTVDWIVRWIYQCNDCLLVQSEAFLEPVRRMASGVLVRYHPNPGDLPMEQLCIQQSPFVYGDGFNIVFAGNLGTVQALDTILEAAYLLRSVKDISFILVGSGSRVQWIRSEIDRLKLDNVRMVGRFPLSAMPSILEGASALIVSLIRSSIMSQTVPSKLQAYLAAGKPIIASMDGEGARIVTQSGAGLSCPAEDGRALAAAVLQLFKLPIEERQRMGVNGLKYYRENFEPHMLAKKLMIIIQNTIDGVR